METRSEGFPIKVWVEAPQKIACPKSSFVSGQMDRLTDLNIFVYHNGQLLGGHSAYYDDVSDAMLSFPVGADGFNIYMFGNVGRVSPPQYESQLPDVRYVVDDYSGFQEHGVPVAGTFVGYRRGDLAEFPLQRLVGQFDISMRISADNAEYVIKDARVMNCAADVYPFAQNAGATVFAGALQYAHQASADMLTQSDIALLNSGQSVSLYFLENLQGELLPWNTDPKKKIPSSLPEGVAEKCTYIEVTADVTTPAAKYTDCRYRFYPGRNETTDFSIVRNTLYEVLLDFSQNMVSEEEWRIEAGEPEVVGVRLDKEEAKVIKGVEDMVFVQAYGNDGRLLDFDVEILSSSGRINVEKVKTTYLEQPGSGEALGLRFTSNAELCGLYPYESEPSYSTETVRITSKETYNGVPLYGKDITVKVYDRLFPLMIKLEKYGSSYNVVVRGRNPLGLGLSVASTYTYGGTSGATGALAHDDVGMDGKTFVALPEGVTAANLSRVDFEVAGCNCSAAEGASEVPSYPKLLNPSAIFTGPDTEAVFGPGNSMCPGRLPKFSDDSPYYITYRSENRLITRPYSYSDDMTYGGTLFHGLLEAWITKTNKESSFPDDCESSYLFGLYQGVHPCEIDSEAAMYKDFSQYENAPFYFVNGGLVECSTNYMFVGNLPRWPDEVVRGVSYDFLGCGRDLFSENEYGTVVNRHHKMGMEIATWKQLVGSKVRTSQKSRYYTAQLYMTINGASCWCGNDLTESGYFPVE